MLTDGRMLALFPYKAYLGWTWYRQHGELLCQASLSDGKYRVHLTKGDEDLGFYFTPNNPDGFIVTDFVDQLIDILEP